jgi:hypothetical protein
MPRGRRKKPVNYEEEIAVFDTQINDLTKKLQTVKDKKKARIKKEDENKDADKWDKIKNSGFSVDELLDMVNKGKD